MSKRVTIEVFSYKDNTAKGDDYSLAIGSPNSFFFKISNGAITHYCRRNGYKTSSAAKNAAKATKKSLVQLKMI